MCEIENIAEIGFTSLFKILREIAETHFSRLLYAFWSSFGTELQLTAILATQ